MAHLQNIFSNRNQSLVRQRQLGLEVVPIFIWVGFVCAISFMEAWLKFQAPGVTLAIGLGIGKLVFGALNKIEWILFLLTTGLILLNGSNRRYMNIVLLIATLILIIQTFYLLPALDARADIILQGSKPKPSLLHIVFIIAEFVKVLLLLIMGIAILNTKNMLKASA